MRSSHYKDWRNPEKQSAYLLMMSTLWPQFARPARYGNKEFIYENHDWKVMNYLKCLNFDWGRRRSDFPNSQKTLLDCGPFNCGLRSARCATIRQFLGFVVSVVWCDEMNWWNELAMGWLDVLVFSDSLEFYSTFFNCGQSKIQLFIINFNTNKNVRTQHSESNAKRNTKRKIVVAYLCKMVDVDVSIGWNDFSISSWNLLLF